MPGWFWVRSLRWGLARPLVAAVVVVGFLVLVCPGLVVLLLSSSFGLVWFGLFWLLRFVLGVGLALALSAWGGGGLVLLWFGLVCCRRRCVVAVLFCPLRGCRRFFCAVGLVVSSSSFLLRFSARLPPPRPRLPPFLFALPRLLFLCA